MVEVIIATAFFSMVMLGVLVGLVQIYKMNDQIRFRNQVSGVLQQLATEFTSSPISGNLWSTASTPTGSGLEIVGFDGSTKADGEVAYLGYQLTTRGGKSVNLKVTRTVAELNEANGTVPLTGGKGSPGPAGRMKIATFTATYAYLNKESSQSITSVRTGRFLD